MRFSLSWRVGYTYFILLGGIFVLISIGSLVFIVNTASQLQRYQVGRCTIIAKQLVETEQKESHISNGRTYWSTTTVYGPDFQFTVQAADGRTYAARGYNALGSFSSDRRSQQAIVDLYTLGKTYPCWYDPENPTQAVLTHEFNQLVYGIPGIFFFIGALFVIIGIVLIRNTFRV